MRRLFVFALLAFAAPGFVCRAAQAQDAGARQLVDRLEADNQTYRDYLARHPAQESAELTMTKRTLGALARDRAFLAEACAAMSDVPEYVDIWEATKLKDDTFKVFALAYNEAAIEDRKARAGAPASADRARCLAVRRNYRASTITFAAQLSRLKRLGY